MPQPPGQVLEAALQTAEQLRLTVDQLDRTAGYLCAHRPVQTGRSHRISVSVTDSGFGSTAIHASWEPGSQPNGLRPSSRLPARIIRRIVKNLG